MAVAVEPWAAYAHDSDLDSFHGFCTNYLIQSKDRWDGLPLDLEPFQLRLMGEAMAFDERGDPVWDSVVVLMPRKNGKTELLAAFALFRLLTTPDGMPEILLAASSDRQAGRLFEAASLYVRKSPELSQLCRIRDHVGQILRVDGGGSITRVAADPKRLHGYNPTLVVLDELAQWTTPELRRAHAALTSGSGARSAPQIFTITTAGEAKDREDGILGRVLDGALKRGEVEEEPGLTIARHHAAKTLVFNYEAPTQDSHDIDALKLANPASWITEDFLRKQAEGDELTDAEVLQLHGGVWAAGVDTWLPAGLWRACQVDRAAPEAGAEVVLAFDGSYKRDSTALVGCTVEAKPHIWVVGVWERPEGARSSWRVPREEVKAVVDEAMSRWRVVELACDPPGWHAEIEEWAERYAGTQTLMFQTNQRVTMTAACSRFYSALLERALTHDGNDRLAVHLGNAVVKVGPNVKYITKEHPESLRKIDLAVAAVMAHDRAVAQLQAYSGPVFEALV